MRPTDCQLYQSDHIALGNKITMKADKEQKPSALPPEASELRNWQVCGQHSQDCGLACWKLITSEA